METDSNLFYVYAAYGAAFAVLAVLVASSWLHQRSVRKAYERVTNSGKNAHES